MARLESDLPDRPESPQDAGPRWPSSRQLHFVQEAASAPRFASWNALEVRRLGPSNESRNQLLEARDHEIDAVLQRRGFLAKPWRLKSLACDERQPAWRAQLSELEAEINPLWLRRTAAARPRLWIETHPLAAAQERGGERGRIRAEGEAAGRWQVESARLSWSKSKPSGSRALSGFGAPQKEAVHSLAAAAFAGGRTETPWPSQVTAAGL